jgi:adenylate cyclase class 2
MEVEVKVRLDDLGPLKEKLIERGAVFDPAVVQNDTYFKQRGTFEDGQVQGPGNVIFRIRDMGGRFSMTSKELTEVRGAWKEYETEITNPEHTRKILESTGLVEVFCINKRREIGKLGEFSLCLDEVEGLGRFMEVELISEESDGPRDRIIAFLKGLGFTDKDIETRGYGEIIGEKLGQRFGGMR